MSLDDDTQRKVPCDRVKDHGARGLGDGPTAAHVEADQSGNVVEAILLKLVQLPSVALSHTSRAFKERVRQKSIFSVKDWIHSSYNMT